MITLSILIPSIPSRFDRMTNLYDKLMKQVQDKPVEILCLIDNKKRSIGLKRDALVQSCKGAYLAFVDDDDDISSDYIDEMLKGCNTGKDIVCFRQGATISGMQAVIDFSIKNVNREFRPNEVVQRRPFHVCGIRSDIAKRHRFPDVGYSEDWHWMERVLKEIKTEYKIDKMLHFYTYSETVSEAPIESNEVWENKDLK